MVEYEHKFDWLVRYVLNITVWRNRKREYLSEGPFDHWESQVTKKRHRKHNLWSKRRLIITGMQHLGSSKAGATWDHEETTGILGEFPEGIQLWVEEDEEQHQHPMHVWPAGYHTSVYHAIGRWEDAYNAGLRITWFKTIHTLLDEKILETGWGVRTMHPRDKERNRVEDHDDQSNNC